VPGRSLIGQGAVFRRRRYNNAGVSVWSKKTVKKGQKAVNNIVSDFTVSIRYLKTEI
jgi:hypothetical protein